MLRFLAYVSWDWGWHFYRKSFCLSDTVKTQVNPRRGFSSKALKRRLMRTFASYPGCTKVHRIYSVLNSTAFGAMVLRSPTAEANVTCSTVCSEEPISINYLHHQHVCPDHKFLLQSLSAASSQPWCVLFIEAFSVSIAPPKYDRTTTVAPVAGPRPLERWHKLPKERRNCHGLLGSTLVGEAFSNSCLIT